MGLQFEWGARKAATNLTNHGVSFDEAKTVFGDPAAKTIRDELHSDDELRFVTVGQSAGGHILVVCHTDREDRIRLISARRAAKRERKQYET